MKPVERIGDEVKINIFPKQEEFISSEVDDVLYGGSAGGGKTYSVMLGALRRRLEHPGSNGIIFRRTYPELEKSIIKATQEIYPLFGATYNQSKREWKFPNTSTQGFGYCFDKKTEILTEDGWKYFHELTRKEKVASLDDNFNIVFLNPTKYQSYHYRGQMISVSQRNGVDFCVTPEHRLLVQKLNSSGKKYKWSDYFVEKAFGLKGTVRIRRAFGVIDSKIKKITFPEVKNGHKNISECDINYFSKFLGWYISEGCLSKSKYDIFIDQKTNFNLLKTDIDNCKFKYSLFLADKKMGLYRFAIHSKELHSWLMPRCGGTSFYKRIPRECFSWPIKALENLLEGLLAGDGSFDKRNGRRNSCYYSTTSKGLADDVQELCLRLNKRATISVGKPEKRLLRGVLYSCKKKYTVSIGNRNHSDFRAKDIKKVYYSGEVFCVTVDPYQKIIVRRNGRAMISMNCEKDGDVYKYLSAEYDDEWFDEATTFTEFQLRYLTSRCRSSNPSIKPLIRLTSNPGGVSHAFIYGRYVKPSQVSKVWTDSITGKTRSFISARISDNFALNEADPDYIRRLKELPEKKYLALAEGRWDVFEGAYFENFDPRPGHGVLANLRKPDTFTMKFLAMDWGFSDPACVLWFEVTPMGRIYIYRELYTTRRSPKELALDILSMCPPEEEYMYIVASPEIWGKKVETEGGGEPIQRLMEEVLKNRMIMKKANNARVPGWLKMREYMFRAPDGLPWLQISPNCTNLINEIPNLVHSDKKVEDVSGDCSDHSSEATRYGIVSIGEIPKHIITPYESHYDRIFGIVRDKPINEHQAPIPQGRGGY